MQAQSVKLLGPQYSPGLQKLHAASPSLTTLLISLPRLWQASRQTLRHVLKGFGNKHAEALGVNRLGCAMGLRHSEAVLV